jgi:sulfonate dioxygenase
MVQNLVTPEVLAYRPPDPPLKEFTPARDRAFFADPEKKSLFAQATAVDDLTPYIGTELKGVQLSKLTEAQKDELALLVAEVSSRDHTADIKAKH